MTAHLWEEALVRLEPGGSGCRRPVYACPRCGARCVLVRVTASFGGRTGEPGGVLLRARVRESGGRARHDARDPVPEDCDAEVARSVMGS